MFLGAAAQHGEACACCSAGCAAFLPSPHIVSTNFGHALPLLWLGIFSSWHTPCCCDLADAAAHGRLCAPQRCCTLLVRTACCMLGLTARSAVVAPGSSDGRYMLNQDRVPSSLLATNKKSSSNFATYRQRTTAAAWITMLLSLHDMAAGREWKQTLHCYTAVLQCCIMCAAEPVRTWRSVTRADCAKAFLKAQSVTAPVSACSRTSAGPRMTSYRTETPGF